MKNKNPNIHAVPVGCYKPKKKDLKALLASQFEARDIIEDLHTNDYLPYDIADIVRGNILLRIEDTKSEIKKLK